MPVVISEIQVTATVSEPEAQGATSPAATPPAENMEELKNEIIKECVDKVMEILRDQKER